MPKARRIAEFLVNRNLDALVRDLAERAVEASRRRVCANIGSMSAAELRGYVRARATGPVRDLVRQLVSEHRLHERHAAHVTARALERTVHSMVCEMSTRPISAMPTAHVPLRLAG